VRRPVLISAALTLAALAAWGAAAPPRKTPEWKTYQDPSFGFSVRFPGSLAILPEKPLPERRPPLLHRVAFLDRGLAASDTAALQPPQLAVEVFAPAAGPLRSWLEANGRLPTGAGSAGVTALSLPGAREALRVRDPHLSAPNEFFYYVTDRGVIALIPLGPEGSAMVETFRLTAER
jgi:hypothetical protein